MKLPSHTLGFVAWSFIIGGSLFAIPSMPGMSSIVDSEVIAATYATGAVFFTLAALGQWLLARGGDDRYASLAGQVQFAGTLFFNISTLRALDESLSASEQQLLVWRPDAFGCTCFLVASVLAFRAFDPSGRPTVATRGSGDWWICVWNLVGSILFGISAIAGIIVPSTDSVLNAALMNSTTMLGAICFVIGAALMRPAHAAGREPMRA